ncbi:hypothetical protein KI387_000695, partial [Taxus chinensis]
CRSEEAFSNENMSLAWKASSAANKISYGYKIKEVGENIICISFSGFLDGRAFRQTTTKFGVCGNNEGTNEKYFGSMIDGSVRKQKPQPALVYEENLKKFLHIWDSNLKLKVEEALARGKTVLYTGHSVGGAVATLATLSVLEKLGKGKIASVYCITFGFPLTGDEVLARAVRRQGWANHFCHVVSRRDIFSRILLAPCITVSTPLEALLPNCLKAMKHINDDDTDSIMEDAPPENVEFTDIVKTVLQHAYAVVNYISATNMDPSNKLIASLKPAVKLSPYRPFGYYVFCSEQGALWVENYEAVLPILYYFLATAPASVSEHIEYGRMLHAITNVVKLKGLSNLALSQAPPTSARKPNCMLLDLETRLALRAAGELENKLIENLENLKEEVIKLDGHMKELNEYRNRCLNQRGNNGYYDTFREHKAKEDFHANLDRLNLAGFYDRLEEMAENHLLPDDFQCNEEWIRRGTEYRLLVEPLDIANYYRLGKHEDSGHYLKSARPRRYKALEKCLENSKYNILPQNSEITRDCCFWAHVEEITWSMNNAKEKTQDVKTKCEEFQRYVKQMRERNELCEEVLMGESSYVKLWSKLTQL